MTNSQTPTRQLAMLIVRRLILNVPKSSDFCVPANPPAPASIRPAKPANYDSLTIFFALRTDDGLMLSSLTPRPIKIGIISGRAAASPHTATLIFAFFAASQTIPIARNTAG